MDKSVVYVYHVSHDDIHTLDGTPVVNTKTWINKIKQFDTIFKKSLDRMNIFPSTGCPESRFEYNLH